MKNWIALGVGIVAASALASEAPPAFEPPAAGDRVAFIGDSHSVGSFGQEMDSLLRARGALVWTTAVCGSSPDWYFRDAAIQCGFFFRNADGESERGTRGRPTPRLSAILDAAKPTVTVVALGANLINLTPEYARRTTRPMVEAIAASGSRCVWIGPPHGRNKPEDKLTALYKALQETSEDLCLFVDSRPYIRYPDTGGDGVHYDHLGPEGRRMAREWARKVFTQAFGELPEP
jgi:hypothetical protein